MNMIEGQKLFFSTWRQMDQWHYEVRENDHQGKVLSENSEYKTETQAKKAMDKAIDKIIGVI